MGFTYTTIKRPDPGTEMKHVRLKVVDLLEVYVDADGCPVKEEVYKVAERYQLNVTVVANKYINIPLNSRIRMQVVSGGFDAADDWIVEQIGSGDIVITTDILLAERVLIKQGRVLSPKGKEWTEENIGEAVGTREFMAHLRQTGEAKGGPAPMAKTDRSQFLSKLDQIIQSVRRLNKA
jgi:uncharacterized protein YaiI (UPF0178 family)